MPLSNALDFRGMSLIMSQPARSEQTLAQAIAAADATLTVLDDRIEIEDRAVFRRLKGHQVHAGHLHNLAIGSQPLPAGWKAATVKIASVAEANHLLQPAGRDPNAQKTLGAALPELEVKGATVSNVDVLPKKWLQVSPAVKCWPLKHDTLRTAGSLLEHH